jgi:hypothetical protein
MKDNTLRFLRTILFIVAGALGIVFVQSALEILFSGTSLHRLNSLNPAEAGSLLNLLNGKLNQAMGVLFIVTGMAVPLTANLYSLKFLELFIRNPIIISALLFVIFVNISGLWANYSLSGTAVPAFQLGLMMVLTIASLLLIFPYLMYVFRFLHPKTLLDLLEGEVKHCLRSARRSRGAAQNRMRVAETVEHIANIAVRSVDRSDRNTAIDSVLSLEKLARHYWAVKDKLHPSWFEADQNFFLGFSSLAVEQMTVSRTWMEMKVYYQFFEALRAACPRMPELTSTIAKSLRKLGLEPASLEDPALRELVIEYFNTFLRLTINRRDVRSVFIIFDQYRTLAETMEGKFPDEVLEVAYYFDYYGMAAREQGLPFVVETVAHDLGALVKKAWQTESPIRGTLLDRFLQYDRQAKAPLAGVKKAHALLASYFLHSGEKEPADLIRQSFRGLDPEFIGRLKGELLRVTSQKYWEVSERRMNIEFVPESQRARLREFFDGLAGNLDSNR